MHVTTSLLRETSEAPEISKIAKATEIMEKFKAPKIQGALHVSHLKLLMGKALPLAQLVADPPLKLFQSLPMQASGVGSFAMRS